MKHQIGGNMDYELMKIGELAAFSGVSPKALRIYEKMKLILPVKVDEENGYRYYSADQVQQVEALLEWKDMGFTLREIKKILSGKYSKEDLSLIMEAKKKEWQDKIWIAQAKIDEIEALNNNISTDAKNDLTKMSDEERAAYLAKMVCINDEKTRQTISEAIWL